MKTFQALGRSLSKSEQKQIGGGEGGCTWCWSGTLQGAPGDPTDGEQVTHCGYSSQLGASLGTMAYPEYENTTTYQVC